MTQILKKEDTKHQNNNEFKKYLTTNQDEIEFA